MLRRDFFKSLLGIFSVQQPNFQCKRAGPFDLDRTVEINGIVVCYQNVGTLPPDKAKKFIEKIGTDLRQQLNKNWQLILTPVRDQESRIEIFKCSKNTISPVFPEIVKEHN